MGIRRSTGKNKKSKRSAAAIEVKRDEAVWRGTRAGKGSARRKAS